VKTKLPKALPSGGGKPSYGQKDVHCPFYFKSRDLAGVSPLSEQFEPKEGEFLPQHQKMAGMD
jgi:hypothetical protein